MKPGFLMAILTSILLLSAFAKADEILQLPEEELAKESVTPVFDKMISTRNRNITTANRMDLTVFYGTALTEPIYSTDRLGVSAYYNTSEDYAWGIDYIKNIGGLTTYAQQLKSQYNLDFSRAPAPDYALLADWNIKAFYGKMSITKDTVVNTQLFGSVGAGGIKYTDKFYPAMALGLGEKFYFTKNWALRADLRLYIHQAPIPFKGSTDSSNTSIEGSHPAPAYSEFDSRITYTSVLDLGVSYLF